MTMMIVGFTALVGLGLAVIMKTWAHIRLVWASQSWVTTEGTVCHTTIDYGTRVFPSSGKQVFYFANVIYQYVVNDKEYSNDQRCFGNDRGSESQALKTAAHYPEGMKVSVVYNPQNPKQSVLESGLRLSQCVPFGFGTILMCGGWWGLSIYGYPWLVG